MNCAAWYRKRADPEGLALGAASALADVVVLTDLGRFEVLGGEFIRPEGAANESRGLDPETR